MNKIISFTICTTGTVNRDLVDDFLKERNLHWFRRRQMLVLNDTISFVYSYHVTEVKYINYNPSHEKYFEYPRDIKNIENFLQVQPSYEPIKLIRE